MISPTLVLNVRYGLTDQDFPERRTSRGFDLASIGFSNNVTSLIDRNVETLPRVTFSNYSTLGAWESGDGSNNSLTHSFVGNFTKVQGSHALPPFLLLNAERTLYRRCSSILIIGID